LCTSWLDYQRWYGGYVDPEDSYLPFAVKGFFDNGGQRLFVARVHRSDASPASLDVDNLQVAANGPGAWGNRVFVRVGRPNRVDSDRFRLTILYYTTMPPLPLVDPLDLANATEANRREPDKVEDYDNLGANPQGSNYVLTTVNGSSQLVQLDWLDPAAPARPADADFTAMANGADGTAAIGSTEYVGDGTLPTNERTGLAGLEVIDPISLLCVPDHVSITPAAERARLTDAVINQCERLKDRFAILQIEEGQGIVGNIQPPADTKYAAVYYPWIRVFDPRVRDTILVPPGGHVTGIIARTDIERGVHKPPANAVVRGIITRDLNGNKKPLEFLITKGQHDILNPQGINVIRDFRADGRGIRLWGARTLSSDPEWKYVNVRRLFLFVEESIEEGTQWVVFEPNHDPTWAAVRRTLTNFLISVWRSGALMGTTQDEAFFVKCDRTTMTQDDIDNGRLICYVGIAPVKPAEFVIFRISQKTADAPA
jgi:phage tail sheath protein FI